MYISVAACELGFEEFIVEREVLEREPSRIARLEKTGFSRVYREPTLHPEISMSTRALDRIESFRPEKVDTVIFVSSLYSSAPSWTQEFLDKGKFHSETKVYRLQEACAGFVSALCLADSLLKSGSSSEVMIVTADNYSKFMNNDLSLEILFSDAVSISTVSNSVPLSHEAKSAISTKLIRQSSTTRAGSLGALGIDESGVLHMNGAAVFQFTIEEVPKMIKALLEEECLKVSDVAWFMHQGSKFVVNQLEEAIEGQQIGHFRAADYGNTVSGSIPFQLSGYRPSTPYLGLAGFGMGLSAKIAILENVRK